MPDFKPSPLGVLKCRDLCTLYYGFPMVANVVENEPNLTINKNTPLLLQDVRRIGYEIVVYNGDAAAQQFFISTPQSVDSSGGVGYSILPGDTRVVERNFLTDLDAVTIAVFILITSVNLNVSTRETFLTPAPVDVVGPTP